MPLAKQWSGYKNLNIPSQVGVYELGYNKNVIYIGSGTVAERISSHDAEGVPITHVRYEVTNSRRRAIQRERSELLSYGSSKRDLPKYNSEIPDPP